MSGPFAGLTAGVAAIFVAGLCLVGVWHRVSGAIGDAVIVACIAVMATVTLAVAYAAVFAALWMRRKLTAAAAPVYRAEVLADVADEAPAITAAPVAAIEPARTVHYHFDRADPGTVAAVLAAREEELPR